MKKALRAVCAAMAVALILTALCSCSRKPGLYAWYGGRMNVDTVLRMTTDAGHGEVVYEVPFDIYRAVFLRNSNFIGDALQDEDGKVEILTNKDKTIAIKEYVEDEFTTFAALSAIAERYGVGLTEADTESFETEYTRTVAEYAESVDDSELKRGQSKMEYAEEQYENSLGKAGMSKKYMEYNYYKAQLSKRVKQTVCSDTVSYVNQSYYRYEQIFIAFPRGDDSAESEALEKINEALSRINAGELIADIADEYRNSEYATEAYFDSSNTIVGSSSYDTVSQVMEETVKSLDYGETSEIIMGDYDDYNGYFAIVRRLFIGEDVVFGDSDVGTKMFMYPFIGSDTYTAQYSTYLEYLTAYESNTRVEPVSEKVYNRIAVNTLY